MDAGGGALDEEDSGRQAGKQRRQALRQSGKVRHINPDQSAAIWHFNRHVDMFGSVEVPPIIPPLIFPTGSNS